VGGGPPNRRRRPERDDVIRGSGKSGGGPELVDVSAVSSNDIWAVGSVGWGIEHQFLQHWDGDGWEEVRGANVPHEEEVLDSVVAVSPHEAWAVGLASDNDGMLHPVSQRWDGSDWSLVPVPGPDTFTYLRAVDAHAESVWAVGAAYVGGIGHTLVLRTNTCPAEPND
jgi:hypothetical protein